MGKRKEKQNKCGGKIFIEINFSGKEVRLEEEDERSDGRGYGGGIYPETHEQEPEDEGWSVDHDFSGTPSFEEDDPDR